MIRKVQEDKEGKVNLKVPGCACDVKVWDQGEPVESDRLPGIVNAARTAEQMQKHGECEVHCQLHRTVTRGLWSRKAH